MLNTLTRYFLRFALRYLVKPLNGPPMPIAVQRFWLRFMALIHQPARGISRQKIKLNGVTIQDINAAQAEHLIIYAHGGAFYLGDVATHVGLTSRLAKLCQARVWSVNYRLAPEHIFPAALEDMLSAYRSALQIVSADKILLAGDSAGGGLTLSTACAIRDAGLPQPAGLILISPWVDLTLTDMHSVADKIDPLVSWKFLRDGIRHYCGTQNPGQPLISPLFSDLHNLPPVLLHCGSDEIIRGDSERLNQRLQQVGTNVTFKLVNGMWHVFPIHAGSLQEADQAVEQMQAFALRCWQTQENQSGRKVS